MRGKKLGLTASLAAREMTPTTTTTTTTKTTQKLHFSTYYASYVCAKLDTYIFFVFCFILRLYSFHPIMEHYMWG